MAQWYLGTMGFSYKDWEGSLYPSHVETRDYLAYYTRFFNAVEIDSTFYGNPRSEYVRRWAEMAPEGFRICAKMPKVVTHEQGLQDVDGEVSAFLENMRLLGPALGVVLIQFPPSFVAERLPLLAAFLETLPQDIRFAVEVRHPSWYVDAEENTMEALLRKLNMAWAATEYESLPKKIHLTTDFLYVRFIGQHGRFQSHESQKIDVSTKLYWWYDHIQPYLDNLENVYGFFNNDYAGFAPTTCNEFKYIAGLPVESFTPPQQGRLF